MTEPGHEIAAGAGGGYRLPVSSVDREQVIRTFGVAPNPRRGRVIVYPDAVCPTGYPV